MMTAVQVFVEALKSFIKSRPALDHQSMNISAISRFNDYFLVYRILMIQTLCHKLYIYQT
jgi:hypothetical protein